MYYSWRDQHQDQKVMLDMSKELRSSCNYFLQPVPNIPTPISHLVPQIATFASRPLHKCQQIIFGDIETGNNMILKENNTVTC